MTVAFNRDRFINTLSHLVSLGERLQNAPNAHLIPEEALASSVIEQLLEPLVKSGFATVHRASAAGFESRCSLIVTVPGSGPGCLSFVGAHFDVVPADKEKEHWTTDPFRLVAKDDGTLRARGVTDCLGHVALLAEVLLELYALGRKPKRTLYIVMIANEEERAIPGIGLEYLADTGVLEALKDGPVYWLDSADFGPTLGTGSIATWELQAVGVAGHSGMPHNCVNALELAMAAAKALVTWFELQVPPHPDEQRWRFSSASSCKPTMIECDNNKITKIPGFVRVFGDMRMTPFYESRTVLRDAIAFVDSLNRRIEQGERIFGFPQTRTEGGEVGRIELLAEGKLSEGIACQLDSPGLIALTRAIAEVRGEERVNPYSMTGSLPLVKDLQSCGFDVQITGFGESRSYHAPNEEAKLSDFEDGFKILLKLTTEP